jgi:hypothetical protein
MSSSLSNSGAIPTLTSQSSGGSLGGNSGGGVQPGSGAGNGGMEELLPLVIQLTKPEQVW